MVKNNNYKILHFSHVGINGKGGTATRHYFLLKNSNNEHLLITPKNKIADHEKTYLPNVNTHQVELRFPQSFLERIPILRGFITNRKKRNKIISAVPKINPDIIHGHNPEFYALSAMRYNSINEKAKFIFDIHQLALDKLEESEEKKSIVNTYRNFNINKKFRRLIKKSDYIIVQTLAQKNTITLRYPRVNQKIRVFPMGVDTIFFNPKNINIESIPIYLKKYFSPTKLSLLYCGSFGKRNGIEFLFEILPEISKNVKNVEFIFIGNPGLYKDRLFELTETWPSHIKFMPSVDLHYMPFIYYLSDVVLIPYPDLKTWENNEPTKLFEAMAMENYIFSTKIKGVYNYLGEAGYYFEYGNKDDFIGKLKYIVENHKLDRHILTENRNKVVKEREWKIISKRIDQFYDDILKMAK